MSRRLVSVVGLPGAGKTTVARALRERLGWRLFVLGDALRERAVSDARLKDQLDGGELAPEQVIRDLVSEVTDPEKDYPLILDGFPRHVDQLEFVRQSTLQWEILHLSVPLHIASNRIRLRFQEKYTRDRDEARSEDAQEVAQTRLHKFRQLIDALLHRVQQESLMVVYTIDAVQSAKTVVEQAARQLG